MLVKTVPVVTPQSPWPSLSERPERFARSAAIQEGNATLTEWLNEVEGTVKTTRMAQGPVGQAWDWMRNHWGVSPQGKAGWDPRRYYGLLINRDTGSRALEDAVRETRQQVAALPRQPEEAFQTAYEKITGQSFEASGRRPGSVFKTFATAAHRAHMPQAPLSHQVKRYVKTQAKGVEALLDMTTGLLATGLLLLPRARQQWPVAILLATLAGGLAKIGLKALEHRLAEKPKPQRVFHDALTGGMAGFVAASAEEAGSRLLAGVRQRVKPTPALRLLERFAGKVALSPVQLALTTPLLGASLMEWLVERLEEGLDT